MTDDIEMSTNKIGDALRSLAKAVQEERPEGNGGFVALRGVQGSGGGEGSVFILFTDWDRDRARGFEEPPMFDAVLTTENSERERVPPWQPRSVHDLVIHARVTPEARVGDEIAIVMLVDP